MTSINCGCKARRPSHKNSSNPAQCFRRRDQWNHSSCVARQRKKAYARKYKGRDCPFDRSLPTAYIDLLSLWSEFYVPGAFGRVGCLVVLSVFVGKASENSERLYRSHCFLGSRSFWKAHNRFEGGRITP